MKKFIFALVTAILVFSCDNGDVETNPFIGTWENQNGQRLVFTNNYVTSFYPNGEVFWKGTYTYDDTQMTITFDYKVPDMEGWGNGFTQRYVIDGNSLSLYNPALTVYTKIT